MPVSVVSRPGEAGDEAGLDAEGGRTLENHISPQSWGVVGGGGREAERAQHRAEADGQTVPRALAQPSGSRDQEVRKSKACREPWTDEEDLLLLQTHLQLGNKWSEIAKCIKGRGENAVKNRFNILHKKYYEDASKPGLLDVDQALKAVSEIRLDNKAWVHRAIAHKLAASSCT
jgi:hypothetical protein